MKHWKANLRLPEERVSRGRPSSAHAERGFLEEQEQRRFPRVPRERHGSLHHQLLIGVREEAFRPIPGDRQKPERDIPDGARCEVSENESAQRATEERSERDHRAKCERFLRHVRLEDHVAEMEWQTREEPDRPNA